MKPIKFPEANIVLAESQPQYQNLPIYQHFGGTVISCWQLSIKERFKILYTGKLWLSIETFRRPLQPQLPSVDSPLNREELK